MKRLFISTAMATLGLVAVVSLGSAPASAQTSVPMAPATGVMAPQPGTFTIVSVLIDDVKFWIPSSIVVRQGDHVKLTLKNMVPGADDKHGFALPAFNVQEIVTRGTPKTVSFVADKVGVFPYFCQLHGAHVGGQLIVLPKEGVQGAEMKH
ncbi:MAG TPA: cupredoxin domain-containing protein [Candidatus Binataceae bacterium]|nr:cupredoxin domain-containing protein [Candidatus Binataceae bacterium]